MTNGSPEITDKVAELNESLKVLEKIQNVWNQHRHDCEIYFTRICDIISKQRITDDQGVKVNVTTGGERH